MNGGDGGNVVDPSAGTLVWVRRRNGSWWPGRIIAKEELAASHLLSARSGTPVKLLGREDASVDWYNLEKSKRVKAFRCGEFDACIKKAEASLDAPAKKREKYARKQDAVIHALKLEQQQYDTVPTFKKRNSAAHVKKSRSLHSDTQPKIVKKLINNKSTALSSNSVLSNDEENNSMNRESSHIEKCSSTVALEEKNDKYYPKMNGLQNFDLSVAPPKKKFKFSEWEAACKPPDNVVCSVKPVDDRRQHAPNQVLLSSAHLAAFSSDEADLQGEAGSIRVCAPGDSEDDSKGSSRQTSLNDETESDSSGAESLQYDISENLRRPNKEDETFAPSCSSLSSYLQNRTMNSNWNSKGKRSIRKTNRAANKTHRGWMDDDKTDTKLVEIEIQVHKQNHRGEHVPWVSLSSKGNHGKPVLGHPVQVEVLQDCTFVLPAYMRTAKTGALHTTARSKALKGVPGLLNHKVKRYPPSLLKTAQNLQRSRHVLPVMACVPVKLVFTRILESVRPASSS